MTTTAVAERVQRQVVMVHDYARAVVAGEILAGPYVRLACERHLRDLETGRDRGLWFDEEAAQFALDFFSYLRLEDGVWFVLEEFQVFIVGSLFGWKREDGHRRFRRAYIEIGKGNGKTPLAAGVGLKGLCADGQSRPEIYAAATTANQARILYRDAQAIVDATPELETNVTSLQTGLTYKNGFFRPVSAEGKSLSGPRPHMGLIDEIHEHATDVVIEKIRAGTKRNLDALILEITNSGASRTTPCWEDHQYSVNVVNRAFEDDSWFAYVCALDSCSEHAMPQDGCEKCDDWHDESVWLKVNPGLDAILPRVYIREQVREAVNKPAKQNIVMRLNFCIWTQQVVRWLLLDKWDGCAPRTPRADLLGAEAYGGLDLASKVDFSSFELWVPDGHGGGDLFSFFWIPEDMTARTEAERDIIQQWAREGRVTLTPGNVTDYDVIRHDIKALASLFDIREIAFDPWNATQLSTQLADDGATMVEVSQGMSSLSAPAKELEAMVLSGNLRHGGHPILRWMAGNVAVRTDSNENIKPDRDKSGDRIDGIVAAVMAIGRWLAHQLPDTAKAPHLWTFDDDEDEEEPTDEPAT